MISRAPGNCARFGFLFFRRTDAGHATLQRKMGQQRGARIPSSALVVCFFCFEGVGAFLAPVSFSSRDATLLQSCNKRIGSVFRRERAAVAPRMAADGDEGDSAVVASNAEEAAAKAAKLRAFAAELRNQVRGGRAV